LRTIAIQVLFVFAASVLADTTSPQTGRFSVAGRDDDQAVEQLFLGFKEAVAKRDKRKVASLMSYPIEVTMASGRRKKISRVRDFILMRNSNEQLGKSTQKIFGQSRRELPLRGERFGSTASRRIQGVRTIIRSRLRPLMAQSNNALEQN
jgi:hypothetical protein